MEGAAGVKLDASNRRQVNGDNAMKLLQMLGYSLEKQARTWKQPVYKETGDTGGCVSGRERDDLARWLAQLNRKFQFHPETLALSVATLDRFLQAVKVRSKYLNCIGVSCLYLAAKTLEEDQNVPVTLEFVRVTQCGCTVSEVTRMERVILDKLNWDLNVVTPLDFLNIFHTMLVSQCPNLMSLLPCQMTASHQLAILTNKLQQLGAHHPMLAFPPATQALTILSLELELLTREWLQPTLWIQALAKVDGRSLIHCREAATRCLVRSSKARQGYMYGSSSTSLGMAWSSVGSGQVKPTKRKMEEMVEEEEEDNIYEGIKRLYNEDSCEPLPTCGRELRHEANTAGTLQAVTN